MACKSRKWPWRMSTGVSVRVIARAGECPLAEPGKRAGHRRDADVAENFPAFYPLTTQLSPTLL